MKYSSFSEAVDKDDGLAVLGVMIEVSLQYTDYTCFYALAFAGSRGSCLNTSQLGTRQVLMK